MNKTLWKLDHTAERLWIVAMIIARESAALENDGRELAVVADETRKLANRINSMVERMMFSGEEIKQGELVEVATMLTYLSLNSAIAALRKGQRGKQAAVCAEEVRQMAMGVIYQLAGEDEGPKMSIPLPRNPLVSIDNRVCFLQFSVAGIRFVENVNNIKEVVYGKWVERTDTCIKVRGTEISLIDGFKMLGKPREILNYVILRTPWAEQDKLFAVASEDFSTNTIFYSPIGRPMDTPADMPLARCVRECWEAEDGPPFFFMDWQKMHHG